MKPAFTIGNIEVVGSTLIVSSETSNKPIGEMSAYNAATGTLLWTLNGNPYFIGSVGPNRLAVNVTRGSGPARSVEVLDPTSGHVVWSRPIPLDPRGQQDASVASNAVVLLNNVDDVETHQAVTVLDGTTGATRWNRRSGHWQYVGDPDVLYNKDAGQLSAVDVADGHTIAKAKLNQNTYLVSLPGKPAVVVVAPRGLSTGPSVAYTALTLHRLWQRVVPRSNFFAADEQRFILLPENSTVFTAHDTETGAPVWSYQLPRTSANDATSTRIFSVGDLTVVDGPTVIQALDTRTGTRSWSFTLPQQSGGVAAVGADVVYLNTEIKPLTTYRLTAVESSSGVELWSTDLDVRPSPSANPCFLNNEVALQTGLIVGAHCGLELLAN